jgi:hypothetical protein
MIRSILVVALAVHVVFAQEARGPLLPVTRQEVWQAVAGELHQRGLREEYLPHIEDLDLPLAVPAAEGRTLRVAATCEDAGMGRLQFRLECREPGQCIPFLAYVGNFERTIAGSCRSGAHWASAQPKKVIVRAGERATVVLVANRLRLTASVICLERGVEGEIIRVKNQDGHIFRARIAAPALLEALPQ